VECSSFKLVSQALQNRATPELQPNCQTLRFRNRHALATF
jgi:hypothetical protein